MINEYLRRRTVKKKVDPSVSPSKGSEAEIPVDVRQAAPAADLTPVQKRIDDLISYTGQLASKADRIIKEVYETNKSDSGFVNYFNLVQENRFNPLLLKDNPTFVPKKPIPVDLLRVAERDVFSRLTDPRAPFIADLYNILDDINLSSLSLQTIWTSLVNPNALYDDFDYNRMVRTALLKEKQYLDMLDQHLTVVQANDIRSIGACFVKSLVDHSVRRTIANVANAGEGFIQAARQLKQIHAVLTWGQFHHVENWETGKAVIGKVFGDFFQHVGQKLMRDSIYSVLGGVYDKVSNFTQEVNTALSPIGDFGDDLGPNQCLDMVELNHQVELVLKKTLERFETDMLHRERVAIDLDEGRAVNLLISQKNSKSKQMIFLIEEAINHLDIVRNQSVVNVDRITQDLENALIGRNNVYKNQVAIRPPGTPPFNPAG